MDLQIGDYVRFQHAKHLAPVLRDANGKQVKGAALPAEEHIGRVEKNPAEGLVDGRFVPIPGMICVLYMSEPHGSLERVLVAENELTLVLDGPRRPDNLIRRRPDEATK